MKELVLIGFTLGLILAVIGTSLYGLVLCFQASIILGVIALIVEPTPLVIGLLAVFGHPEVAGKIAAWLGLS